MLNNVDRPLNNNDLKKIQVKEKVSKYYVINISSLPLIQDLNID
jgi:hypothetical protein